MNTHESLVYDDDLITGNSSDIYWKAPHRSPAAFVRLRRTTNGGAQVTLKSNDKGDNIDRVEIDLEVNDYDQAKELLSVLHGEQLATVKKRYNVYFLENHDTNISVYQIANDDRIFVEIEGRTLKRVTGLVKGLSDFTNWKLSRVTSSVYDIFVAKKEMHLESLDKFLS